MTNEYLLCDQTYSSIIVWKVYRYLVNMDTPRIQRRPVFVVRKIHGCLPFDVFDCMKTTPDKATDVAINQVIVFG